MTQHQIVTVGVPGPGAEDVLVATDGTVWTGTADGAIHALDPEGRSTRLVARTGGRPLGLEWLPDGRLLVCDAECGLLAVSTDDGSVEVLVREVDGQLLRFTNNAAVGADGTIWFSDSSRHYGSASGSLTSSPTPGRDGSSVVTSTGRSRRSWTVWPSPTGSRSRVTGRRSTSRRPRCAGSVGSA